MRVKVAKTAGFCMGVRRAMDAVLDEANKAGGPIYILGPLVHNRQAMEMLEAKSVKVVKSIDEVAEGIVFIRAHGVTPEVRKSLDRPGIEVRDLTCPHVRRAQLAVKRYADQGCRIIILGDEGHSEVVGLLGYAKGKGHAVSSPEEICELPSFDKVCLVAQTTQSEDKFALAAKTLRARYPDAVIRNTICNATNERQAEVRELAGQVDAMVVVGGKHSANTVRLAEVAMAEGVPTFLVETASDLNESEIRKFKTVGVTAGASTPHWVFGSVVDKVNECLIFRNSFLKLSKSIMAFCVYSYAYIGAGSAAMTYGALKLLGIQPRAGYLTLAAMYVVSMHLVNRFTDKASAKLNDPRRMELLEKYKTFFVTIAAIFIGGALALASMFEFHAFLLMLAALIAGVAYNFSFIPKRLADRLRFKSVREIPGSKDFFVSFAWAVVTVLFPFLASGKTNAGGAFGIFIFWFIMVFIRSLIFDLRDMEGDRIVGKETLPLILGAELTRKLIMTCVAILAGLAFYNVIVGWAEIGGNVFFIIVAYIALYLYVYYRRAITHGLALEAVVDAQFLLAGLLAAIAI